MVDKTVIRAPFSGTIGLRQVSPGAHITPTTVIATLQQLGRMKIDFTIPEENSHLIAIGRTIDVRLEGQSSDTKKATIIACGAPS
ncbi:MAG: HlyD family efflux transporter periplasmic adaptor subunit [Spirosomataceae bacterium]